MSLTLDELHIAVPTHVRERVEPPLGVSHDHDRLASQIRGELIATVFDLLLAPNTQPFPAQDALQF